MGDMIQFYQTNESDFSTGKVKLDIASMVGKETIFDPSKYNTNENKPRKKRTNINGTEVVTGQDETSTSSTMNPYKDSYAETDNVLKGAISQLDIVTADLSNDIREIRASKTLRNKYEFLSTMTSSLGTLIGSKISAARELNNSIKNSHELELKRTKEFKLNEQVDDTKAIMDTYNAFVSMPVSASPMGFSTALGPNTQDLTLLSANLLANSIGGGDSGYENYMKNMTPEQAMMMYENNPDIKQVVVYNQDTFEKHFEIMNMRTGEIMHGLPKRNDLMYMPDTTIDTVNKIARNVNLDEVYDVIVVGKGNMSNY